MNTPTPKTDEAWSCFSGYTEPLQDVKDLSHELERELTAVTEQRDGLHKLHNKNAARYKELLDLCGTLRKELTAVTEQRDGLRAGIDYASDQLTKVKEQRDRLADALQKLADCDWVITMPDRMDAVRVIANEALQSLNQPTETKTK